MKYSLNNLKQDMKFILKSKDCNTDIDWILCDALAVPKSKLFLVKNVSLFVRLKCLFYANKRAKGVPLNQILGYTNFYGLKFITNKNVLCPRFETELLVENVIKNYKSPAEGLDLGTGSGAIAITLNKLSNINMVAVDVSKKALKVARKNQRINHTLVQFVQSNFFDKLPNTKFDFIVSNPPYIKTDTINDLDTEVKNHEPLLALDGGVDGLNCYRVIANLAHNYLKEDGKLFLEIGYDQAENVKSLFEKNFCNISIIKDYAGIDRIVVATKIRS